MKRNPLLDQALPTRRKTESQTKKFHFRISFRPFRRRPHNTAGQKPSQEATEAASGSVASPGPEAVTGSGVPKPSIERLPRLKLGRIVIVSGELPFTPSQSPETPILERLPLRFPPYLVHHIYNVAWNASCTFELAAEILLGYGLYRYSAQRKLLHNWQLLTRRQQQVLRLAMLDYTVSAIGKELDIVPNTVRFYLKTAQQAFAAPTRHILLHELARLESLVAGLVVDFGEEE